MKVLAIVVLVVSSISARGSGPYLPSGWRPQGPAFYLPSEAKPAENPLKDTILQESEASGSEFLREYGPPKIAEVSQDITKQSLPEVATEQAFFIEAKFNQEVHNTENIKKVENAVIETETAVATEGSVDLRNGIEEEIVTVTEQQQEDIGEVTTVQLVEQPLIQGKSINLETEAITATSEQQDLDDITTEKIAEQPTIQGKTNDQDTEASVAKTAEDVIGATIAYEETVGHQEENINSEVRSVVQEKAVQEAEIKAIEEGVKNIAEAVLKQEENLQVTEARTAEESSGSIAQFPEGFLEYGPPSFREYGPPKGDELLRTGVEEKPSESQLIDNNETRRRRFSPKFGTTRRQSKNERNRL